MYFMHYAPFFLPTSLLSAPTHPSSPHPFSLHQLILPPHIPSLCTNSSFLPTSLLSAPTHPSSPHPFSLHQLILPPHIPSLCTNSSFLPTSLLSAPTHPSSPHPFSLAAPTLMHYTYFHKWAQCLTTVRWLDMCEHGHP